MQKLISGSVLAALMLALPMTANAQEDVGDIAQETPTCTATIAPIQTGQTVDVTATFTSPFGEVTEIEAPEESGLALATDDGMDEMAAEEEDIAGEEPVEMGAEYTSTVSLDAANATAGTYEVVLKNEAGDSCTAEVTVEEPSVDRSSWETDAPEAEIPETPEAEIPETPETPEAAIPETPETPEVEIPAETP